MFPGDPFRMMNHMHRMMEDMDAMMMDPFGPMMGPPPMLMRHPHPFAALTDGHEHHHPPPHHRSARARELALDPFGGFGIGGIFNAMNHLSERAMHDPNAVIFSQSTAFTWGPDGQPKVVENSVRKTGDVKETRRRVQDGGEEHMSIGHHIGDRTHVIEKKRDKDGNVRKQQKFVNLDEANAEDFDREFQQRARNNLTRRGYTSSSSDRANRYLEDASGTGSRRSSSRPTAAASQYCNLSNGTGASSSSGSGNTPIITLPEEEEEADKSHTRSSNRSVGGGPIIREISEEEASGWLPKKRRGLFGEFKAE
ncbi:hypothetical protein WR25_26712 isoform B [Diploscapter pachys]|uniref:Myeloid leukemia factor n=3 Tax=Diploscapter pachys TaxID=2018661 RepID=A0A2A2L8N8_9BILA|nr:hypothetical protein WR25_26712 isoform B [Diploscapter pachys]